MASLPSNCLMTEGACWAASTWATSVMVCIQIPTIAPVYLANCRDCQWTCNRLTQITLDRIAGRGATSVRAMGSRVVASVRAVPGQHHADLLPAVRDAAQALLERWPQVCVAHQIGDLELQQAGLTSAEHFA